MSGTTPYVSKKKASAQLAGSRYEDIGFGVGDDEDSFLMQDRKKSYDTIAGSDEEDGHHGGGHHGHKEESPRMKMFNTIKIVLIASFFVVTILVFMFQHSHDEHPLSELHGVSSDSPMLVRLDRHEPLDTVKVTFTLQQLVNYTNLRYPSPTLVQTEIQGARFIKDPRDNETDIKVWFAVPDLEPFVIHADPDSMMVEHHYFYLNDEHRGYSDLRLNVSTNSQQAVGMKFHWLQLHSIVRLQVLWGLLILILVYVLIVFELVHRTIAALLGSFWGLAVLSVVQERPAFLDVISWIDYNTIGLLFGMMLMVGIFSTTGFFEWSAVRAYKYSQGDIWRLVVMLCLFTAVASMFLDNVTTILLVAPVTLRLCRVIDLDPLPIILTEVIFSNIGGTATGIGDPPNILIISNIDVVRSGVADFTSFTVHVGPGAVLGMITTMFFVKWYFHESLTKREPKSAAIKEIEIWKRTAIRIQTYSEEEKFVKDKLLEHIQELEAEAQQTSSNDSERNIDISELEEKYVITDYPLFYKCVVVLAIVVMLFFLHPFVHAIQLTLPWIAIIGAMALLTISGIADFQEVIEKVEMGTLLFFGGLFVLMRCVEEMEVMEFIAHYTAEAISVIPAGRIRLAFSVLVIMWVCAIVSALIDNIPFTQTMIPIVVRVSRSGLGLPLGPLLWSLAFGACLGGNGTLIGASANVVAAGIAEQQGYPISFLYFFKYGAPCMVVSMITATFYMLVSHVLIPWY